MGEISRKVAADWVWLLAVFFIDCQVHELPALYAAWEIRGRCHNTLQQQNHSQVGRSLPQNRVGSFEVQICMVGSSYGTVNFLQQTSYSR
jgi:hypothetical protein